MTIVKLLSFGCTNILTLHLIRKYAIKTILILSFYGILSYNVISNISIFIISADYDQLALLAYIV